MTTTTVRHIFDAPDEPTDEQRERIIRLIESVCGKPDAAADRAVQVIHAQAAALEWVHETTGAYPAPLAVADQIEAVARRLRPLVGADDDPATILHQVAVEALAKYQRAAAL
jgi:hypothetical protein